MENRPVNQNKVIMSFGSNYGDRMASIREALEWTSSLFAEVTVSEIYETEPISGQGAPYLNAVAGGETPLPLEMLERMTKELERKMGRTAERRERGEVPIDIDIVVFNGEILRQRDFDADFFQKGYDSIKLAITK